MIRSEFESFDGKQISYVEWNEVKEPKGIVQISHGMAEHVMRYEPLARALNMEGIIVVADDHRGHGETDSETLGNCKGDMFFDTLKDIATLTKLSREKYPDLKVILFGHSYGSFLAQAYIERYPRLIDGAIIGGSAYMKQISVPLGGIIAAIGCKFKGETAKGLLLSKMSFGMYNKKFKTGSFVSSLPYEVERYETDKYCHYDCSYNFYRSFFKGLSSLYKSQNIRGINTEMPLLLIAGENDPVGSMGKSMKKLKNFYESIGCRSVKLKLFENARHEYLNDVSREESMQTIIGFCIENSK